MLNRHQIMLGIFLTLSAAGNFTVRGMPAVTLAQSTLPIPTPQQATQPDRCEANDTREQPCVLLIDAVSGPFTFAPDGDQDFYSIDLGVPNSLDLAVTVRATDGLDLRTTLTRAGQDVPITTVSSPVLTTTLSADVAGWIVLQVENRAPIEGGRYTIDLRRVLPAPPPVQSAATNGVPDLLENNWSVETAAPIGVGVVYDLSFVCPVPWGCGGGDYDYLALPVKAGLRYLLATFDLGPGVDTMLDLFWGDPVNPIAHNDDLHSGASFLSVLHWQAPSDGVAIIRVGPRTGGLLPTVIDDDAGRYRFIAALADSDLARQIESRIVEQAALPTPAPASSQPTTSAPSASATQPLTTPTPMVATDAPKGTAIVGTSTTLREEPHVKGDEISSLIEGSQVTLLGEAAGAWVRVQPTDGVVPGWVYGPDLQLASDNAASVGGTTEAIQPTAAPKSVQELPTVHSLPPLELPPTPPPLPAEVVTLDVRVVGSPAPLITEPDAFPTTLPDDVEQMLTPVAGLRVQLTTVFGDVLAEALTDEAGRVMLSRDILATDAVFVQVPALGVAFAVDRSAPTLTIMVPREVGQ